MTRPEQSSKQGGYEAMILSADGTRRIAVVELSMDEQLAIEAAAKEQSLPVLAAFPRYWEGEHRVSVEQIEALLEELARIERDRRSGAAVSGASKISGVAAVAARHKLPLDIVTD